VSGIRMLCLLICVCLLVLVRFVSFVLADIDIFLYMFKSFLSVVILHLVFIAKFILESLILRQQVRTRRKEQIDISLHQPPRTNDDGCTH